MLTRDQIFKAVDRINDDVIENVSKQEADEAYVCLLDATIGFGYSQITCGGDVIWHTEEHDVDFQSVETFVLWLKTAMLDSATRGRQRETLIRRVLGMPEAEPIIYKEKSLEVDRILMRAVKPDTYDSACQLNILRSLVAERDTLKARCGIEQRRVAEAGGLTDGDLAAEFLKRHTSGGMAAVVNYVRCLQADGNL